MKNKENYCKFVIQFNSIQFNSIPKIISLIALLFSISCSSNEEPKKHSKSELVGTWNNQEQLKRNNFILDIDSEGNLNFNCGLKDYSGHHYNYSGKLADTFNYPYTIELTFTASSHSSTSCKDANNNYLINEIVNLTPKSKTAKFTFTDASTCTVSANMIYHGSGYVIWMEWNSINSFKKQ